MSSTSNMSDISDMSDTSHLSHLSRLFPKERCIFNLEEYSHYAMDWTQVFSGRTQAQALVFPKETGEVQNLVRWALQHRQALIPSGGRTGLSGGAVATRGEVIVSFEKMNRILNFNPLDQTLRCQAGVVTSHLQDFVKEKGLFFPLEFAARSSSQVGGNIATNAGGANVICYGNTRDQVLSLQVVTGKGELLELNPGALIKNATGYDLRHLFIGSEGTLGFITEATFRLHPTPPPTKVLLLAIEKLDSSLQVLLDFRQATSLLAFEFFCGRSLRKVLEHRPQLKNPLATSGRDGSPFYLLLELVCKGDEDEEKILHLFEKGLEKNGITDGVLSQSHQQAGSLWALRESISESIAPLFPYKNDISVAPSQIPPFVQELEQLLKEKYPQFEVLWFGHIGDGNLHINILKPSALNPSQFVQKCEEVNHLVFKLLQKYRGSISAEHGVGLLKKKYLGYSRSPEEIEIMKQIKKVFDPQGILNPGKIFDL